MYAVYNTNISDKSVFPFYPDRDCQGFREVLQRYKQITPGINLSGPTNFAPLIRQSITVVQRLKSVYCLFFIIIIN